MDLLSKCRICSDSKSFEQLENIFEIEITYNTVPKIESLHKFISGISGITVTKNDKLPQNICIKCKEDFQNAAKLVKLCQESDHKFRSAFEIEKRRIKEEFNLDSNYANLNKEEPTIKLCQTNEADSSFHSEDETITSIKCESCQKEFISEALLHKHKCNSNEDRPYMCDKCDLKFKSKSNLIGHRKNIHEGVKPYSCEQCAKSFFSSAQLKIHVMRHNKEYPHLCAQCGRRFAQQCNLKEHQKIHSGIKDIKCLYCDFTSSYQTSMKTHVRGVHNIDKKHQCSECGLKFMFPSLLIRHATVHTGIKSHFCNVCKKNFRSANGLKQHERIHSNEKPYKCKHCEKVFRTPSHRSAHIQIHTGKKNHVCIICKKSFLLRTNLIRHQKIHNKTQ